MSVAGVSGSESPPLSNTAAATATHTTAPTAATARRRDRGGRGELDGTPDRAGPVALAIGDVVERRIIWEVPSWLVQLAGCRANQAGTNAACKPPRAAVA